VNEIGGGVVLGDGCEPKWGNFAQSLSQALESITAMNEVEYVLLYFFWWAGTILLFF
jgi:hypothetical protein